MSAALSAPSSVSSQADNLSQLRRGSVSQRPHALAKKQQHSFTITKCLLLCSRPVCSNWLCLTAPALSISALTIPLLHEPNFRRGTLLDPAWSFCVVRDQGFAMRIRIRSCFKTNAFFEIYLPARINTSPVVDISTLYRRRLNLTWGAWLHHGCSR